MGIETEIALEEEVDRATELVEEALMAFSPTARKRSLIRLLAKMERGSKIEQPVPADIAAYSAQGPATAARHIEHPLARPLARFPVFTSARAQMDRSVRVHRIEPAANAPSTVMDADGQEEDHEESPPSEDGEAVGRTTRKSALYAFLLLNPHAPIKSMALYLYQSDDAKACGRVRSLLDQLKRANLAVSRSPGVWEALSSG